MDSGQLDAKITQLWTFYILFYSPQLKLIIALFFSLFSCTKKEEEIIEVPNPTESTPNILFIIADDMGKDATNGFAEGKNKPKTPNIDAFKNTGITFQNFWVYQKANYPTCWVQEVEQVKS